MKSETAPGSAKRYPMPFTRLELVVLTPRDAALHVLLARRAEEPQKDKWALPGGVLRTDLDDSLEAATQRVAKERLGVELPFLRQICAVGGPGRYSERAQWALSVVYRALVPEGALVVIPGKRVKELIWRPADEAALDRKLAFDHSSLIARAIESTRAEVERLDLPVGFVPEKFTLGELQAMCEQLLGRKLDKSSFRRRLADRETVEPVVGEMKTGANRPAQVFRLNAS